VSAFREHTPSASLSALLLHLKATTLPTPHDNLVRKLYTVTRGRPLILCIEDDPLYLTLRKKMLEQNGYNVIGVTSPEEALKNLSETPVCATIADHMLDGTTGTELAKQMKQLKPEVPIVLFSGKLPEHLNHVDVFINKGEPLSEFLRILRGVVERFCA
jgi:CheY-like chemotaxis protein